jgi:uncharacterized protein YndB with AHSA1/START domain
MADADREIVMTRVFDAPRARVFDACTDPAQIGQWWGPAGFTCTFETFDPRPGGHWRFVMHGPDGTDYPNENVFVAIDRPARIVLDHVVAPRFRLTATFEEVGARTRLTLRQVFDSAELRTAVAPYAVPGSEQMLDRLAGALAGPEAPVRDLVFTRRLAAPRALVWRLWTDPLHLARSWGPDGFTNPVCEADVRPGGRLFIRMRGPDGTEYPMRGAFLEVVPPQRLVFATFPVDQDGNPQIDGRVTVTLEAEGEATLLRLHARAVALVPYAVRFLDGAQAGWTQCLDRLGTAAAVPAAG